MATRWLEPFETCYESSWFVLLTRGTDLAIAPQATMGLDLLLKRYFVLVILFLLGIAAYFQASGVSQFIGARLGVDAKALVASVATIEPPPRSRVSGDAVVSTKRSAAAIIERNPFDSETGPLVKQEEESSEGQTAAADYSNPYGASSCRDGIKVLIITASEDPGWSMAALAGGSEGGSSQMRRIGDTYAGKKVWYIAWDRVWLEGGGELCQVKMFGGEAEEQPAAAAPAPTPTPAPPTGRGPRPVPAEIASKIQKVSATEFNVDRTVVDQIMENQAELMRSARIVPEQENGKVVGVRLYGIRPDTLLGTLGLQNGDRLETINGFNMASPEKALEAYARLRTANHLSVSVNRNGKPVNIDFNIK